MSDVSDDEDIADIALENELSVEEKAAKVRAEIKRRRARMADAGRGLQRHYSLDEYNIHSDYAAECDPLLLNDPLTDSYDLSMDSYGKSKYLSNAVDYPLSSAKDKYFSDE